MRYADRSNGRTPAAPSRARKCSAAIWSAPSAIGARTVAVGSSASKLPGAAKPGASPIAFSVDVEIRSLNFDRGFAGPERVLRWPVTPIRSRTEAGAVASVAGVSRLSDGFPLWIQAQELNGRRRSCWPQFQIEKGVHDRSILPELELHRKLVSAPPSLLLTGDAHLTILALSTVRLRPSDLLFRDFVVFGCTSWYSAADPRWFGPI